MSLRDARPLMVLTVIAAVMPMASAPANATAAGTAVKFAPHRAIYDITLERAASGSGVVELVGRMVYELNGSQCEGYTQNMRFVTQMVSQDGSEQVNDLRTSSWEDGAGTRLRFNSEQYRDAQLIESTAGDARRAKAGDITVDVTKPAKQRLTLPGRLMFPMQHSAALVTAARTGQRHFIVGLYDGSEKGAKVYDTSAWIGSAAKESKSDVPKGLAGVDSWPVSIGYFEPGSAARDALPAYELSFHIFANGVSTQMVIDYGEFAVRGELRELTYLSTSECSSKPAQRVGPVR